ncbi:MAG: Crp/Fnr family transcriptional regulator [Arenimonas sp.]|nr:Crp/Fnr family transcriptional regulator [Arenimonas sp.]
MTDAQDPGRNRLLAALPPQLLAQWAPHLAPVLLPIGQSVYEPGATLQHVLFPTTALVSLLHVLGDGHTAEIAVVGNDGVVGVSLFMGGGSTSTRGVVQGAGWALRLPVPLLQQAFAAGGAVPRLLLLYTQALIAQMSQTAACNRHHGIDQQLCRWLLLSLDRIDGCELAMTQELIANMLGVRREGVTAAASRLQRQGLIRYARGHIAVLDRRGLEQRACECYAVVRDEYERLLPRRGGPPATPWPGGPDA